MAVRALLAAIDARDAYTCAHSELLVAWAVGVARRFALSPSAITDIEHVALLHDVGKLGVPDSVLGKPGALTEDEWGIMREHPAIGARVVGSVGPVVHLAPAVRAEHERWDGRGYPDGLAGASIPLASRIVLACDALHAMTSDRPYRAAMSRAEAFEELCEGAGSQFDPRVVEALLDEVKSPAVVPDGRSTSTRNAVLVVEDNDVLRMALNEGLSAAGFTVEAVGDVGSALACAETFRPAVVLLDWVIPGGGGATACRRLLERHPTTRVVIHTGLSDLRDRRAAREAGAVDFLQKGIPLDELADRLRALAGAVEERRAS